jgi:hypothetical protein
MTHKVAIYRGGAPLIVDEPLAGPDELFRHGETSFIEWNFWTRRDTKTIVEPADARGDVLSQG